MRVHVVYGKVFVELHNAAITARSRHVKVGGGNIITRGEVIDIAIVDQKMPIMTGTELIEALRSNPTTKLKHFVLLSSITESRISASGSDSERTTHISKPARQTDLYNCLAALLGDNEAIDASIRSNNTQNAKFTGTVLLVEDNPVNQDMMLEMLRRAGITAELCENGKDAMELLAEKQFDLVFMDCQMPVMDGFAATGAIRKNEANSESDFRQPIVALTADAAEPTQSVIDMNAATSVSTIDHSVFQTVVEMCANAEPGFYERLVSRYEESANEDLEAISGALAKGDAETVRTSAHRLKSSSGNWGGVRVSGLCQQIESAAAESDLVDAADAFKELETEAATLIKAISMHKKAA